MCALPRLEVELGSVCALPRLEVGVHASRIQVSISLMLNFKCSFYWGCSVFFRETILYGHAVGKSLFGLGGSHILEITYIYGACAT